MLRMSLDRIHEGSGRSVKHEKLIFSSFGIGCQPMVGQADHKGCAGEKCHSRVIPNDLLDILFINV